MGIVLALLGLANLLLGVFLPGKSPGRLPFLPALTVIPVLLAFWLTEKLVIPYFRWDPSGRTIARELRMRKVPPSQLSVADMSRGLQYSLSFYLHEEIKPWDRDHPREGYLLTGTRRSCRYWSADLLACEELPFNLQATGRFLYLVTLPNSALSPADRGQVQQKK